MESIINFIDRIDRESHVRLTNSDWMELFKKNNFGQATIPYSPYSSDWSNVTEWLYENVGSENFTWIRSSINSYIFYFTHQSDATLFSLRFS